MSPTTEPQSAARSGLVDDALRRFDTMPADAYVRLPVVCALFSCSVPTVWRRVKAGAIPKPYKLSPGMSAWRVGELRTAMINVAKAA